MGVQAHVGEGRRGTERSVVTGRLPGRRSTGWLPSAFRLLLRTCAHRHGRRYSGPRPPRNDRVAGRAGAAVPSPRPRSPEGASARLLGERPRCSARPPARAQPPPPARPPPARYLVLAAAPAALVAAQQLRDGQRGCVRLVRRGGQTHVGGRLRPRSLQRFSRRTAGAGRAALTNKPRRPAPRPSLHCRARRLRQCRPAGSRSPAPRRPGWGACGPGQRKQAGRPSFLPGADSQLENRLAGWDPGWKMQPASRDSGKGGLPSGSPGTTGRPFISRKSAMPPRAALATPGGIRFSLLCTNY